MATRVQKMTLERAEYEALVGRAGEESYAVLAAYMRGGTHVADLKVRDLAKGEETVVVFLESETFPENDCCWKLKADEVGEWLFTFVRGR